MTKSAEEGENEITRDLKRQIGRAGVDVCARLRAMRKDAERRRDKAAVRQIVEAEKYFGCRNQRKRGRR
ncbi:MAG: hypothetical protein K2X87_16195 [Gemmataceae bacterium]|nr:hypothetical protein [Gemmataceae bacterium]